MGHFYHLSSWLAIKRRIWRGACCLLLSVISTHAQAASNAVQEAYYLLQFSGITLGRVRTETLDTAEIYRMSVDTKSKSFAALFSPFQTIASIEGIKRNGHYLPQHYRSHSYKSDEGDGRSTDITYDKKGAIIKRQRVPLDDAWWRPEVPLSKANQATDPITSYLKLTQALGKTGNHYPQTHTLYTYDGRRLAKFTVTVTGHASIPNGKHKTQALLTRITRTPLDGYTPKEWAKYKKGDPRITASFTDEKNAQLLRLDVALIVGTISVVKSEE